MPQNVTDNQSTPLKTLFLCDLYTDMTSDILSVLRYICIRFVNWYLITYSGLIIMKNEWNSLSLIYIFALRISLDLCLVYVKTTVMRYVGSDLICAHPYVYVISRCVVFDIFIVSHSFIKQPCLQPVFSYGPRHHTLQSKFSSIPYISLLDTFLGGNSPLATKVWMRYHMKQGYINVIVIWMSLDL